MSEEDIILNANGMFIKMLPGSSAAELYLKDLIKKCSELSLFFKQILRSPINSAGGSIVNNAAGIPQFVGSMYVI